MAPGGSGRRPPGEVDLESLVGRYGTLALATLTILLGVAAFISWAIARHLLGPEVRVAFGAVLAAVLAAVGWRFRRRGSVSFSNALLGLSLAVVQVDAWGAGPRLHLISSVTALTIVTLISAALAALARVERDQVLFNVGVGGALLAPFVTSDGTAHVVPLLIYGLVVLELALMALDETWEIATGLVLAGAFVYAMAGQSAITSADSDFTQSVPGIFAILIALSATLVPARVPRTLVAQGALATLVVLLPAFISGYATLPHCALCVALLAAAGTVVSYATLARLTPEPSVPNALGVALFPVVFMSAAMSAAPTVDQSAALGVVWAGGAIAAAFIDRPARRGAHFAVAAIMSGAAIVLRLVFQHPLGCIVALSAHAAVVTVLMDRRRERLLLFPAAGALLVATVLAFLQLDARTAFHYVPFGTPASGAAFAVSVVSLLFSWYAWPMVGRSEATPIRVAGLAVTFFWVREELAGAVSPDASTFFLIAYYAIVGVGGVFLGRARAIPLLRHVGLALAVYASIKAVAQASELGIGLRIGSYFLAGLFMLAVAYWYRTADLLGTDRVAPAP